MRERLCQFLCCPECRGELQLEPHEQAGGEILTGLLVCSHCNLDFRVVAGVPRFVPATLSYEKQHTARNFGTSWQIWHGIDDERYRWQLLKWLTPLTAGDFRGKTILDAGCGKGRHLRVLAQFGASDVIGVDLSEAVDVAYANTRTLDNVHVIQADLLNMPLKGGFDVVLSVGVLHHTPDPARSFGAITRQVRGGGTAACWVYGRENNGWIVRLVNPIRIGITRHLPSWVVRALAWGPAAILFLLIYLLYLPAEALGIKLFYQTYMLNLKALGFAECRHIVYDHLVAPTTFYLRRAEVEGWFRETGISKHTISWVNRNSWSGVGVLPAPA